MTPNAARRARQHATGWAFAGSQRHIQAYVNTPALTQLLDDALRRAMPQLADASLEWRSPLAADRYAEPQDAMFWPAIGHPNLAEKAVGWWPQRGGPSWDAIATAHRKATSPVVVLLEAKANPSEVTGRPLAATSPKSMATIAAALNKTRATLGATGALEAWTGPHYQLANRITWTLWLRQQHIDAVLAHVLFDNDLSHRPATADELAKAVRGAHKTLGIPSRAIAGWVTTIAVPATG